MTSRILHNIARSDESTFLIDSMAMSLFSDVRCRCRYFAFHYFANDVDFVACFSQSTFLFRVCCKLLVFHRDTSFNLIIRHNELMGLCSMYMVGPFENQVALSVVE